MKGNALTIDRLLGIAAVGASVVKARLVQRFIKDLANVITLAIATGFMVGAFLIGGFYLAYQWLTRSGLDPFAAQMLIGLISAVVILVLLGMSASYLQRLRNIPGQIVRGEFPLSSRINGLVDSFLDGLLGKSL